MLPVAALLLRRFQTKFGVLQMQRRDACIHLDERPVLELWLWFSATESLLFGETRFVVRNPVPCDSPAFHV